MVRLSVLKPEMAVLLMGAHWSRRHRSDRKSTRLNSSHITISYAVFCLKKKNKEKESAYNRGSTAGRGKWIRAGVPGAADGRTQRVIGVMTMRWRAVADHDCSIDKVARR